MFTGIVRGLALVISAKISNHILRIELELPPYLRDNIELGASIAVNGVCLTVVKNEKGLISFDVIPETLQRTNLSFLQKNSIVNVERAARFGDEIGGHQLSGHVFGMAVLDKVDLFPDHRLMTLSCPQEWIKYLFPKGYVALNGVSLTLVDVRKEGFFTVHLIPETIRMTTWGNLSAGDRVNVEFDTQIQAIVDTTERYLEARGIR